MTGLLIRIVILCGLLAAVAATVTAVWRPAVPTTLAASRAETATPSLRKSEAAFVAAPLAAFPDTLKRPLFFEGRTMPERKVAPPALPVTPVATPTPPASTANAAATTIDGFKLRGVLVQRGQARALIEAGTDGGEWHGVGAKVRDWTIEAITTDRVTLRLGRRTATLEFDSLSPASPRARTR